jgi:heme-degrading monooxygenase HmoA
VEPAYTHTTWVVRPDHEAEFVERWQDWVEWSHHAGLQAHAVLLRDVDNPGTYVSFGPWESVGAVRNWRALRGYQDRVKRLSDIVERFEPRTFTVVAET